MAPVHLYPPDFEGEMIGDCNINCPPSPCSPGQLMFNIPSTPIPVHKDGWDNVCRGKGRRGSFFSSDETEESDSNLSWSMDSTQRHSDGDIGLFDDFSNKEIDRLHEAHFFKAWTMFQRVISTDPLSSYDEFADKDSAQQLCMTSHRIGREQDSEPSPGGNELIFDLEM